MNCLQSGKPAPDGYCWCVICEATRITAPITALAQRLAADSGKAGEAEYAPPVPQTGVQPMPPPYDDREADGSVLLDTGRVLSPHAVAILRGETPDPVKVLTKALATSQAREAELRALLEKAPHATESSLQLLDAWHVEVSQALAQPIDDTALKAYDELTRTDERATFVAELQHTLQGRETYLSTMVTAALREFGRKVALRDREDMPHEQDPEAVVDAVLRGES